MNLVMATLATFFWVALVVGIILLLVGLVAPAGGSSDILTGWFTMLLSSLGIVAAFIWELLTALVEKAKMEPKPDSDIPRKGLRRPQQPPPVRGPPE